MDELLELIGSGGLTFSTIGGRRNYTIAEMGDLYSNGTSIPYFHFGGSTTGHHINLINAYCKKNNITRCEIEVDGDIVGDFEINVPCIVIRYANVRNKGYIKDIKRGYVYLEEMKFTGKDAAIICENVYCDKFFIDRCKLIDCDVIHIRNTRNIVIYDTTMDKSEYGIYVNGCINCELREVTARESERNGITLENCEQINFYDVRVYSCKWDNIYIKRCHTFHLNNTESHYSEMNGITIHKSHNFMVKKNSFIGNANSAICNEYCRDFVYIVETCSRSKIGVSSWGNRNFEIRKINSLTDMQYGIRSERDRDCFIKTANISKIKYNGIYADKCVNYKVNNVNISECRLDACYIDKCNRLYIAICKLTTSRMNGMYITHSKNIIVNRTEINDNYRTGLVALNCKNITINMSNKIFDNENGMYFVNITDGNIIDNEIKNHEKGIAIHIESVDTVKVIENKIDLCRSGIILENDCVNCTISNNVINKAGIEKADEFVYDNTIGTDEIKDLNLNPLLFKKLDKDFVLLSTNISCGIMLYGIANCKVANNEIKNSVDGIVLKNSLRSNIENNDICNNKGVGFTVIDTCNSNSISNNTSKDNKKMNFFMGSGEGICSYSVNRDNIIYGNDFYNENIKNKDVYIGKGTLENYIIDNSANKVSSTNNMDTLVEIMGNKTQIAAHKKLKREILPELGDLVEFDKLDVKKLADDVIAKPKELIENATNVINDFIDNATSLPKKFIDDVINPVVDEIQDKADSILGMLDLNLENLNLEDINFDKVVDNFLDHNISDELNEVVEKIGKNEVVDTLTNLANNGNVGNFSSNKISEAIQKIKKVQKKVDELRKKKIDVVKTEVGKIMEFSNNVKGVINKGEPVAAIEKLYSRIGDLDDLKVKYKKESRKVIPRVKSGRPMQLLDSVDKAIDAKHKELQDLMKQPLKDKHQQIAEKSTNKEQVKTDINNFKKAINKAVDDIDPFIGDLEVNIDKVLDSINIKLGAALEGPTKTMDEIKNTLNNLKSEISKVTDKVKEIINFPQQKLDQIKDLINSGIQNTTGEVGKVLEDVKNSTLGNAAANIEAINNRVNGAISNLGRELTKPIEKIIPAVKDSTGYISTAMTLAKDCTSEICKEGICKAVGVDNISQDLAGFIDESRDLIKNNRTMEYLEKKKEFINRNIAIAEKNDTNTDIRVSANFNKIMANNIGDNLINTNAFNMVMKDKVKETLNVLNEKFSNNLNTCQNRVKNIVDDIDDSRVNSHYIQVETELKNLALNAAKGNFNACYDTRFNLTKKHTEELVDSIKNMDAQYDLEDFYDDVMLADGMKTEFGSPYKTYLMQDSTDNTNVPVFNGNFYIDGTMKFSNDLYALEKNVFDKAFGSVLERIL